MADTNGNGKIADVGDLQEDALKRTVQRIPEGQSAFFRDSMTFFLAQNMADEIEAWGGNIKRRDMQLRDYMTIEPMFASALATVSSRNASFQYRIVGEDEESIDHVQSVLQQANFGRGWHDLILKASIDLYTQDSGAFIEVIRERNDPDSPLVGLASLDAARCFHTGHPDAPVVYLDRNNVYHYLKWWQVIHLSEMPTNFESLPGMQLCALTRLLREVQIARDTGIYIKEKIGGRNARAVTLVKGVTPQQIDEAWQQAKIINDGAGLLRFSQPIMVGSVNPNADIGFETLELASIPDGFSLEERNKWYVAIIAMAFLSDYQEFAPLPGGGLGTASQSETQAKKSRGKGAALFQKLISQSLNWLVLPPNMEFEWADQDLDEETADALARKTRAEERQIRITAGEISVEVAQMRAFDSGDLTQEQFDQQQSQNEEMKQAQEEQRQADLANLQAQTGAIAGQAQAEGEGTASSQQGPDAQQRGSEEKAIVPSQSRRDVEDLAEEILKETFSDLLDDLYARHDIKRPS